MLINFEFQQKCWLKSNVLISGKNDNRKFQGLPITNRSQPSTPGGREKRTKTYTSKNKQTNVREPQRPAHFPPNEVIRMFK